MTTNTKSVITEQEEVNKKETSKKADNKKKKDTKGKTTTKKSTKTKKAQEKKVAKEQTTKEEKKIKKPEVELLEMKDKYIRLSAEFDNYRKRTLKERIEYSKNAGEEILVNILPVMDDFERAIKSMKDSKDSDAIKEGIDLIYNKFKDFLKQKGVKEIDCTNQEFDTDIHEAITKIPAPEAKLKGKIIDVIEKGYYLNEKVIRYSKVVIGE